MPRILPHTTVLTSNEHMRPPVFGTSTLGQTAVVPTVEVGHPDPQSDDVLYETTWHSEATLLQVNVS